MISNCFGCEYEFNEACCAQEHEGLFLATGIGHDLCCKGKHFMLIMVDDKGKIIMR